MVVERGTVQFKNDQLSMFWPESTPPGGTTQLPRDPRVVHFMGIPPSFDADTLDMVLSNKQKGVGSVVEIPNFDGEAGTAVVVFEDAQG